MTTIIQTRAESSPARDSRGGDTALHGASTPPRDAAPPRRVPYWTPERTEELEKLWREGLSASTIARRLGGVTRNAVLGKVFRLGEVCAPRSRQRGQPWRKYDHGLVLDMWAAGKTAREIAAVQGMAPDTAKGIVFMARCRGDKRAIHHSAGRRPVFAPEARRRGMTPSALRSALIHAIVVDNLFDAVLGKPGEAMP